MLLPSIFDRKLANSFFNDDFFNDMFLFPTTILKPAAQLMNTNIKDLGEEYQMEIELPGYDKKDIQIQLDKGYLIVSANKQETKETGDDKNKYIHKERLIGSCKRSFYVGKQVKEEDFHASFDNGILKLLFPKKKNEVQMEDKKYIPIA